MTELRTTALHDRHEALGASFTDFGGWLMPVRYSSDLAEHHAVRTGAGLFDISHMAEFLVTGRDAAAFLDYALAGSVSPMRLGKAKYSLVLAESGGIIDDVIVYRLADDRFLVIANAGNRDAVATAFAERIDGFEAELEDQTDDTSLIAVQGPAARAIVEATAGIADVAPAFGDLGYYAWSSAAFDGEPLFIARTGYTGEDGFELLVPNHVAAALWDALLAAGEPLGLVPAGLAARDTLRLEAGMPLYGHELSLGILPAQAGLGRVVAADKADFVGRAGLSSVLAPDAPVL
ncbi:MAG TPA: glycine cleavage system aminomethyltransferase GcvT, partial [Microbacterium sp.]|nr:glycine cleavage system aminomethyltransferase GcvT [Microbacterium sp.]